MYEVYIDLIFLMNLIPEYIIYAMTVRVLHYRVRRARIISGSVFTSIITCAMMVIPLIPYPIRLLITYIVGKGLILWLVFRIRRLQMFLKALLLSCGFTFIMGGLLEWLCHTPFFMDQKGLNIVIFLMISGISYLVLTELYRLWKWLVNQKDICPVQISYRGRLLQTIGFVDTGNLLREPISGKPVSILGKLQAEQLGYMELAENYRVIPYYSIGNPGGLLHGFMADRMLIEINGNTITVEKPMLGVCDAEVDRSRTYEMILSAKLINQ